MSACLDNYVYAPPPDDGASLDAYWAGFDAHLAFAMPVFERFCTVHGFRLLERVKTGRYPRVRVERDGLVLGAIDFWMANDEFGKRYTTLPVPIPYELGISAGCVESRIGRVSRAIVMNVRRPFKVALVSLPRDLEAAVPLLDAMTQEYLYAYGEQLDL